MMSYRLGRFLRVEYVGEDGPMGAAEAPALAE
jgi:hypothetical protein